jgi:hypothetical protein
VPLTDLKQDRGCSLRRDEKISPMKGPSKKWDDDVKDSHESLAFGTTFYAPTVFASNAHNEYASLCSRALAKTYVPDEEYMFDFITWCKHNHQQLFRKMKNIKSVSFSEYIERSGATPSVKRAIIAAKARLTLEGIDEDSKLDRGLLYKYSQRKAFVKQENLLLRSPLTLTDDSGPRLIQGASPEFIALTGPWFMAVQDKFKTCWGKDFFLCFSSGMTSEEAAQFIMGEAADDDLFLEDDMGKFDSSIDEELCKYELWLCKRFGAPQAVYDLFEANIKTHGVTTHGWRYKIRGTRKSGDPWTSVFNSVLNGLSHAYIFCNHTGHTLKQVIQYKKRGKSIFRMILQGDDNVMRHIPTAIPIPWVACMRRLGFDSEAEYRSEPCEITFCSMMLIKAKNWLFVPLPGKVLAKFGYIHDRPKEVTPQSLLRGVALGLSLATNVVPVLRAIVERVLVLTEGHEAYFDKKAFREHQLLSSRELEYSCTDDVNYAMYKRYGVVPSYIEMFESQVSKMELGEDYPDLLFYPFADVETKGKPFMR